ncbi:MAG: DUF3857 and transglutaminase domain-containing protein [Chitinophagaceae bacterium]|nr:DUF3857 and transglutaminase domain-containing protein [Chitinophagaceae bacterium]
MRYFVYRVIIIPAIISAYLSAAQSVEEIKAIFPGEQAVVRSHTVHYTIKLKDGQPQAESDEVQELMYLSDNAGSFMSRYSFYHSGFHQVKEYEAYTISPSGKKITVKDFKTSQSVSNSVFYDDMKQTSFDFPSITPGAVGHLEYTTVHTNPRLLSPHYFSRYVPVINGELKITFPKDMSVKYMIRGNYKEKVQFTSENRKGETTYSFKVANLPKELNYPDAPDNSYYSLHVIFYIENYRDGSQTVSYMANLDDLYKLEWSFVKDINKSISPELKNITDSIVRGISSNEEKARRIYKWVQKNIKYVAFEEGMEGFIPREANLVCNRRFGDCKDMSSILTVMLNQAGVPAYYTWIGSRALPYDYTEVPLPITDNHMITTIKLDTGYVFLDGTDSHCVFGAPSGHIQGKQALVGMNEKEFKIIRVPELDKEKNQLTDTTYLDLTDKGITGSVSVNMTGYYAMDMHSMMSYTNEKDREKYMRGYFNRGSNKFKLNKYEIGETDNPNTFRLTGQFELQDYGKKIADEWYLNLNLFKFYEHGEIDYPKRNTPIEHDYKNKTKYVTILNIPEGYKVSYLPESRSFRNDVWGFDITYEQKKNQVVMTQTFENNHLLLQPDKFQAWNKVLENLFPLYRETISLSKK